MMVCTHFISMKKKDILDFIGKTGFIIPILVTVFFTFFMVQLVLFSFNKEELKLPLPSGEGIFAIIANISLFISIAIVAIALIYLSKKVQRSENAHNIFIIIYLIVGTILVLLFGKQFFNVPANTMPLIYVFFGSLAYLGFYSIYLIVMDILPERLKNFIFIIYSSIIGIYLGISLPATSTIAIILALSFVDLFWVYYKLRNHETNEPLEKFMVIVKYPNIMWGIGLGDLTCYALLVTCSFMNFGVINSLVSIILILAGSVFSMREAEKHNYFPGLPLSTGLGLIPIFLGSVMAIS